MDNVSLLSFLLISIINSFFFNLILRTFARKKRLLIDIPNKSRKFHKRPTPMTGGISILINIIFTTWLYVNLNNLMGYIPIFSLSVILGSGFIVLLFLVNDIKNIKPIIRLIIQTIATYIVIHQSDIYIASLGNLFGTGEILLGEIYGKIFTIFCVVGVMNAFNMIDGIDGLCSGISLIVFCMIGAFFNAFFDSLLIIVVGSVIGFMFFNLGIIGKKRYVFLGDHGSNLMGFLVAWLCIYFSQQTIFNFQPITALWLVFIPVVDCLKVIFNRFKNKKNLSSSDRDHIHFILSSRNFSTKKTLLLILFITFSFSSFGILLQGISEVISLIVFMIFSIFYYMFTNSLKSNNV
jgi:UDP-GlcNAc:undecaprenyl-phosphate GlcNAc-1-phosphate transferase